MAPRYGSEILHHIDLEIMDSDDVMVTVCECPLNSNTVNTAGVLNGGVLATLLDTAGGTAAARATGCRSIMTRSMHIDYIGPITVGPARATATVERIGKKSGTVVCTMEAIDVGTGTKAAVGTITLTAR